MVVVVEICLQMTYNIIPQRCRLSVRRRPLVCSHRQ